MVQKGEISSPLLLFYYRVSYRTIMGLGLN